MTVPEQAATAGTPPAVAAHGLTKRFPGVLANDRVSFAAARGEVHALLGENGAGKTTLCNMLTGLYRPDEGHVEVDGRQVRLRSPRDAHAAGIFMVHQHLRLVESMTVAENVVLGWSARQGLRFSPRRTVDEVAECAGRYKMDVDPNARIWQLSLGVRQRVEILKALYRGAHILILDEPTTVLTPQEEEQLFASLRGMAAAGSTVVVISHKLPEVTAASDRITVLRRGRSVTTVPTGEISPGQLARLMVGREVGVGGRAAIGVARGEPATARPAAGGAGAVGATPEVGTVPAAGPDSDGHRGHLPAQGTSPPAVPPVGTGEPPALRLVGVHARGDLGPEALHGISLEIRPGEVLGVAGVAGNGQLELAEVIAGLRPATAGTVEVGPRRLATGDSRAAIAAGVGYIPEDRMGTGVAPDLSITDNLMLKSYREPGAGHGPLLRGDRALAAARAAIERFDIRAPGPGTLVRQLSGGNVQRVLLARELSRDPTVLVAASPTRGLDVGATEDVRRVLRETAGRGVGVLLISEDLDEVFELADRVLVLYEGRVAGVVDPAGVTDEQLGLMMAGATVPAVAEPRVVAP